MTTDTYEAANPTPAASTVADAIRHATQRLLATSDTARLDAEVLMAHALRTDRSQLLLRHMRDPAPSDFTALVKRRMRHEPVAYITGQQEFFGLLFSVCPDVLIPRGDSETLVEAALALKPDAKNILDCGTGSGALLLAVLSQLPEAQGLGIDRSAGAVAVARENALALGLSERAEIRETSWLDPQWSQGLGRFDLILANPPYVEDDAVLDSSVRDFEPASALFAGAQGLDDYTVLIPQIPDLLAPNGVALVEIGFQQADAVCAIGSACGLTNVLYRDLAGRARVIAFSVAQ